MVGRDGALPVLAWDILTAPWDIPIASGLCPWGQQEFVLVFCGGDLELRPPKGTCFVTAPRGVVLHPGKAEPAPGGKPLGGAG